MRALVLAVALTFAAAAPAHASNQVVTGRDSLDWDKPNVVVAPGETVTWTFPGTEQFHNVKSNGATGADPEWGTFRSELNRPAPDKSYEFKYEGTYNFVCEVHTSTMSGTVTVSAAPVAMPAPTPVPLSAQPYVNDDTSPVVPEKVIADRAAPRLTGVSARRLRHAARVRFRVSEEATVVVRFKRAGRTVRTVESTADGLRAVTVRMRRGRYRVDVRATDIAGNRSSLRKTRVTVR